jgi:hypothetical protein
MKRAPPVPFVLAAFNARFETKLDALLRCRRGIIWGRVWSENHAKRRRQP